MDYKHHPNSKKTSRTIASNTNTVICGVCGTKQYFKTCLHNDHADPHCIPNPEWHSCADAFGKCSRIEPLLSSPSLFNPLYPNTALLQAPPNVFHSHSSMGVRLMPSSTPCLNKEKQDALPSGPIHNSKSSMSQSIKKGKTRPGTRPKSRAGCENFEKTQPQCIPGEPNCCQLGFQQNCWHNYARFIPYTYQPLAVPVAHMIPFYVPVGSSDIESNCENTASQTETVLNTNEELVESDDDLEKLAKQLVMEQGFDSDVNEDNLEDLVGKFDEDVGTNDLDRDENNVSTVQDDENNDKDEWSSHENYQEKDCNQEIKNKSIGEKNSNFEMYEARDKDDSWTRKSVTMGVKESSSNESHKNRKKDEDEDVYKNYKQYDDEGNYLDESSRMAEALKEKKINSDFEENRVITPRTPTKMSLNEYDYDPDKKQNGGSQADSVSGSEGEKSLKSKSNDSRSNFKDKADEDDVDRIFDSLEGIKSSKEESLENLNLLKQEESEENESDDDKSDKKFKSTPDLISDTNFKEVEKEAYKVINVYKKEILNEDGKEDWLDTEEEILGLTRKDSYDNLPINTKSEMKDSPYYKYKKDQDDDDFMKIKKVSGRKEEGYKRYKENSFSPRNSARLKSINLQDQGGQGEKVKNVTNKLIYTAIINKKEEREKGDTSPCNSPRWRDESKRNLKRPDAKKRWMI